MKPFKTDVARYLIKYFGALLILCASGLAQAVVLQSGGSIVRSISTIGEVDTHTFTAQAGDAVLLRVADIETTATINSAFSPRISLINPNGVTVTASQGALVGDILLNLTVSGQYSVQVSDSSPGNDETGQYRLYFTAVPSASEGGLIISGQSYTDRIDLGDIDSYTFSADAGDVVYLRVADKETTEFINSDFNPWIGLFDPDGDLINFGSGALVGDLTSPLIQSGTFTVVIVDESVGDDAIGDYELFFGKAPATAELGNLQNGQSESDEITLGDIDTFSFNGTAGDFVFIRVADTETTEFIDSEFNPFVALYDPDGDLISISNGALVADISASLIETGQYTVIVTDESVGDDAIGSYELYYSNSPGVSELGDLPNGGVVSDRIDLGDLDTYSFAATAGDFVYLRAADTETTEFVDSEFNPYMALIDPDGNLIVSSSGALVADVVATLQKTGTYSVVITDESVGDDATGDYDLYYAKALGANEICGVGSTTVSGRIDLGDIDSLSFTSSTPGAPITISVTDDENNDFTPFFALYGPLGIVFFDSDTTIATRTANLNSVGTYTLVIMDESVGEDASGNYTLSISGNFPGVPCAGEFCNQLPATVILANGDSPTNGDDVIIGTSGADLIIAGAGNDTICAGGGADMVFGGGGDDWISGENGFDEISGGGGNDILFGGNGFDHIDGGGGDDEIYGEAGDDSLFGRTGEDMIDGGNGVDAISGGPSSDTIYTGAGSTVGSSAFVSGGGGADMIIGGSDNDDLRGGSGADEIFGNEGGDVITGGAGRDQISGGAGGDTIRGQDSRDTLDGGSGSDEILGGAGDDTMIGGGGNDICNGQAGDNDVVSNGCETILGVP